MPLLTATVKLGYGENARVLVNSLSAVTVKLHKHTHTRLTAL